MPDLSEDVAQQLKQNRQRLVPNQGTTGHFLAVVGQDPFQFAFRQVPEGEIGRFAGSPDGELSAPIDSLVRNTDDHTLWINTDGETAWTEIGGTAGTTTFPITYDDGTYTYTIRVFADNIINQVTENGAGDALLSQTFLGADGLVELADYTGGGIHLRCTDGGGGIHLDENDGGGIFLNADDGGGIELNDAGGGGIRLDASGGIFLNLPTSDPAVSGQLWNDSGTVTVSP